MPVLQKWTKEEGKELHPLFKRNFQLKKCHNTSDIDKAVTISLKHHGLIHKRTPDNVSKNYSNMLINLKHSENQ